MLSGFLLKRTELHSPIGGAVSALLRIGLHAAILLAALCVTAPVTAASWRDELPQAQLLGSGDLRWFGLKIYSASLWSDHVPFDPEKTFALELTYQRSISRARIVQTSIDEIHRLFPTRYSQDQLKRWEAEMTQAFTDVEQGDQLTGVYLPGRGCRFYSSNQFLGEVRDTEFARAFFAIWLDPRSKDAQLRNGLLGTQK